MDYSRRMETDAIQKGKQARRCRYNEISVDTYRCGLVFPTEVHIVSDSKILTELTSNLMSKVCASSAAFSNLAALQHFTCGFLQSYRRTFGR